MEQGPESHENAPRNLRTHPEETLAAMGLIEGPEWLSRQSEEASERWHQNVGAALKRLRGPMRSHFVVEGAMVNRWLVNADGEVVFLQSIKAGSVQDAARARSLGFRVKVSPM